MFQRKVRFHTRSYSTHAFPQCVSQSPVSCGAVCWWRAWTPHVLRLQLTLTVNTAAAAAAVFMESLTQLKYEPVGFFQLHWDFFMSHLDFMNKNQRESLKVCTADKSNLSLVDDDCVHAWHTMRSFHKNAPTEHCQGTAPRQDLDFVQFL